MRSVSKEVDTTTTKMTKVTRINITTTTTCKNRALHIVTRMTISNNIERRTPIEVIDKITIRDKETTEVETNKSNVRKSL